MSAKPQEIDRYDTPAKIRPEHVVINPLDPDRWWKFEVRDDSPLGLAYHRGQLATGRREYTAEDRYGAGTIYRGIYDGVHGSDCAVSNFSRVSGAGNEARSSERLCVARDLRAKVEREMSKDNYLIVDQFCGAGSRANEAVRARFSGFEKSVYQAICVALDDLLDAVQRLGLKRPI